ncbi:MAG: DUF3786 domain-containing protein [Nitrospirae bacterium]|nr:DUF3786 domain-containing protein [Nitrospirota bacterium]
MTKIIQPLDIYKKMPRTNCGRCPAGTCMAFAVQFLRRMILLSECREIDEHIMREIEAMLSDSGDWKERRLKELFDEISATGFSAVAHDLGVLVEGDLLKVVYMGREITLSRAGFNDELDIMDKLLILMYIKQAGSGVPAGKWAAFREFKDGLIRSESFHGACEIPLAKMFEGSREGTIKRLTAIGAEKVKGFSTEHSYVIYALPKLPLLVLLWPGDEEFGADCKILLDSTATVFLDVEALLYLGMALVRNIKGI